MKGEKGKRISDLKVQISEDGKRNINSPPQSSFVKNYGRTGRRGLNDEPRRRKAESRKTPHQSILP